MTKDDALNLVKDHVEMLEVGGRRQVAAAIRLLCGLGEGPPEDTVANAAKRGFDPLLSNEPNRQEKRK